MDDDDDDFFFFFFVAVHDLRNPCNNFIQIIFCVNVYDTNIVILYMTWRCQVVFTNWCPEFSSFKKVKQILSVKTLDTCIKG